MPMSSAPSQPDVQPSIAAPANAQVKPLAELDMRPIVGILTDVDDTLTEDGRLHPQTYAALWQLRQAGIPLIPVTGRSTGWAHLMLSQWPVDVVIAESGGTWLARAGAASASKSRPAPHRGQALPLAAASVPIELHGVDSKTERMRTQLMALCAELIAQHPPLKFALDNQYRCVDVAIDYNEEVRVPRPVVDHVLATLRAAGFYARTSSIHINAWHGDFDKGPTALKVLQQVCPQACDPSRWLFVGDAPNDQSMFALFPNSIGVANIRPALQAGLFDHPPGYVTQAAHGAGFVEVVQRLLAGSSKGG